MENDWGSGYDRLLTAAYIIDEDTYEILYLNDAAKAKFVRDSYDGPCYKVLFGRDEPCDNCKLIINSSDVENWNSMIDGVNYRIYARNEIREGGRKLRFCVAVELDDSEVDIDFYKSEGYWKDAVLEHTREFFACFDKNYTVIYSNTALSAITGWNIGDKAHGRYLSSKSAEHIFGAATHKVLQGETWSGLAELRSLDGRSIPCETDLFPIVTADGEIVGIAVSMLDITAQLELKNANARLQLARKAAKIGVWEMSIDDQLFSFDEGFKELMEVPFDSPVPLSEWADHIEKIMTVEALPSFIQDLRTHFDGSTPLKLNEVRYDLPSGKSRYMSVDSIIRYDAHNQPQGLVGMLIDSTENALSRQKSDKLLDERLKNQEIISNFSMMFAQPYENFDDLMNKALSNLQSYLNPDRIAVVEMQEDKEQLLCAYECRKDESIPSFLGSVYDYDMIRPMLDVIDKESYYYIQDTTDFYKRFPYVNRGGKSVCYVPIMAYGKRMGYLLFTMVHEQAEWTEENFDFIKMVGSIIMGAYTSKAVREKNESELRMNKFIQEFTAPFLQPYEFDEIIYSSLKKLLDYSERDRASLFLKEGGKYVCKYSATRTPDIPAIEIGDTSRVENVKSIIENLEEYSYFFIHDTSDPSYGFDEEFYKGMSSICFVPLSTSNEQKGFLSISMRKERGKWKEEFFRLSVMVASVISGAVATRYAVNAEQDMQQKLQMVLSSSSMGVWEASVSEQLLYFDYTMAKLFRLTKPSPITLVEWADFLSEIVDVDLYGDYIEYVRNGYDGLKFSDTFSKLKITFPDGSVKYIKDTTKSILGEDGKPEQVIGLSWDITEDVSLVRQLEETTLEAAKASNAKSDFLSRMSHEMRTPLNAIVGWTNIASGSSDLKKRDEYLESITSASEQLLAIINNVLDISKIESGKMDIYKEPFSLIRAIRKSLSMVEEAAEDKSLNLESYTDFDQYKKYVGDETRITQILVNLLSNAVKFTPDGGTVSLSAEELIDKRNDMPVIQIIIKDTGIGMTEEQMSRAFSVFEQADGSTTRRYGGTGLGLPISKNLVERMGGTIEVRSKIDEGSRFIINLPLAYADDSSGPADADEDSQNKQKKNNDFSGINMLLAEDIEVNRIILESLLESTGIEIDSADNGKIAVEKYKTAPEKYDIIFMDIHMPELDGLDATRQIRSMNTPNAVSIPIVALSASAFREDVEKCINAGMTDHIAKPIDIELLMDKINQYVK